MALIEYVNMWKIRVKTQGAMYKAMDKVQGSKSEAQGTRVFRLMMK